MYSANIARAMKSENLSLKTIINELDFFKKNSYYSLKRSKKRFPVACKQINGRNT